MHQGTAGGFSAWKHNHKALLTNSSLLWVLTDLHLVSLHFKMWPIQLQQVSLPPSGMRSLNLHPVHMSEVSYSFCNPKFPTQSLRYWSVSRGWELAFPSEAANPQREQKYVFNCHGEIRNALLKVLHFVRDYFKL